MPFVSRSVTSLAIVYLLAGQYGNASAADGAGTAGKTAPAAAAPSGTASKVTGPPAPWKDMNAKQRGKYMKTVVSPNMKVIFQAFDGEKFKKFGCETCHGKDPQGHKFKMPTPDIHPLPPTPTAFQEMMKKKPEWSKWTKFMGEQVVPQMAAMLGQPVFDPKNPKAGGFGCQNCHTISKL